MEPVKIFIDTNIVLDYFTGRFPAPYVQAV